MTDPQAAAQEWPLIGKECEMKDGGEADSWLTQMFDLQSQLAERAVKETNRLRTRVRELEAHIAAQPSDLWALQERVTQLEMLLKERNMDRG